MKFGTGVVYKKLLCKCGFMKISHWQSYFRV